ncbi:MAG: DNA-processing protein DprA [Thermodesulfovibrionales bacterium]
MNEQLKTHYSSRITYKTGVFQESSNLLYLLGLSLIKDIGPVMARSLIDTFGSAKEVFSQTEKSLMDVEGIGQQRAKAIREFNRWKDAEAIIKRCNDINIEIVSYLSNLYPENLKTIPDPPLILYMMGKPLPQDALAIAIVGSRRTSDYGRRAAEKLSRELAELGITIVSGLARGIDTIAHTACLRSGGRTIGVSGSGLDRPYPPENKELIKKIINNGYVISEFPPGTPPYKENFPQRNRLISGLSLAVIVVEAEAKSGALITAGYGLEQGREVFAVPGGIFSKTSQGTNSLIKKGAKPVTSVNDIFEELAPRLKGLIKEQQPSWEAQLEFSDREKAIINIMTEEPLHIDEITRKSGMSISECTSILLELELKGAVRQLQGKRFYLIKEV